MIDKHSIFFNVTFNKWMWGRDTKLLSEKKKLNMYTLPQTTGLGNNEPLVGIFSSAWHFSVVFHWNEKFQSEKKPWNIILKIK